MKRIEGHEYRDTDWEQTIQYRQTNSHERACIAAVTSSGDSTWYRVKCTIKPTLTNDIYTADKCVANICTQQHLSHTYLRQKSIVIPQQNDLLTKKERNKTKQNHSLWCISVN